VILACAESGPALNQTVTTIAAKSAAPVIRVRTKKDLVSPRDESHNDSRISVSANTGEGLQDLLDRIDEIIAANYGQPAAEVPMLTSARHERAIRTAMAELENFEKAWRAEMLPAPVASVHLRTAVSELEELIGAVDLDEVLDRVFRTFCVGK
jgi:tRNA modification GTPase